MGWESLPPNHREGSWPQRELKNTSLCISRFIAQIYYPPSLTPVPQVLLCDAEGGITEGLVTNFCVVAGTGDGKGGGGALGLVRNGCESSSTPSPCPFPPTGPPGRLRHLPHDCRWP